MNKIIPLLLVFLLSVSLFSCSSGEDAETKTENERQTERETANPSIGIGMESKPDPVIPKNMTVCVDPGHGYVDGGTGDGMFPDGILEKDVNLAVANYLSEALVEMGFTVTVTHDGNTFPKSPIDDGNQIFNTYERSSYVNSLDIDYFISLHVNSYPADTSIRGSKLFFVNSSVKKNPWSEEISDYIATAIEKNMPDEPIPKLEEQYGGNSYVVLRETNVPATLVEMGFCTNKTDAKNMINPEWQKNFAQSIADGILEFYEKSGEFNIEE